MTTPKRPMLSFVLTVLCSKKSFLILILFINTFKINETTEINQLTAVNCREKVKRKTRNFISVFFFFFSFVIICNRPFPSSVSLSFKASLSAKFLSRLSGRISIRMKTDIYNKD